MALVKTGIEAGLDSIVKVLQRNFTPNPKSAISRAPLPRNLGVDLHKLFERYGISGGKLQDRAERLKIAMQAEGKMSEFNNAIALLAHGIATQIEGDPNLTVRLIAAQMGKSPEHVLQLFDTVRTDLRKRVTYNERLKKFGQVAANKMEEKDPTLAKEGTIGAENKLIEMLTEIIELQDRDPTQGIFKVIDPEDASISHTDRQLRRSTGESDANIPFNISEENVPPSLSKLSVEEGNPSYLSRLYEMFQKIETVEAEALTDAINRIRHSKLLQAYLSNPEAGLKRIEELRHYNTILEGIHNKVSRILTGLPTNDTQLDRLMGLEEKGKWDLKNIDKFWNADPSVENLKKLVDLLYKKESVGRNRVMNVIDKVAIATVFGDSDYNQSFHLINRARRLVSLMDETNPGGKGRTGNKGKGLPPPPKDNITDLKTELRRRLAELNKDMNVLVPTSQQGHLPFVGGTGSVAESVSATQGIIAIQSDWNVVRNLTEAHNINTQIGRASGGGRTESVVIGAGESRIVLGGAGSRNVEARPYVDTRTQRITHPTNVNQKIETIGLDALFRVVNGKTIKPSNWVPDYENIVKVVEQELSAQPNIHLNWTAKLQAALEYALTARKAKNSDALDAAILQIQRLTSLEEYGNNYTVTDIKNMITRYSKSKKKDGFARSVTDFTRANYIYNVIKNTPEEVKIHVDGKQGTDGTYYTTGKIRIEIDGVDTPLGVKTFEVLNGPAFEKYETSVKLGRSLKSSRANVVIVPVSPIGTVSQSQINAINATNPAIFSIETTSELKIKARAGKHMSVTAEDGRTYVFIPIRYQEMPKGSSNYGNRNFVREVDMEHYGNNLGKAMDEFGDKAHSVAILFPHSDSTTKEGFHFVSSTVVNDRGKALVPFKTELKDGVPTTIIDLERTRFPKPDVEQTPKRERLSQDDIWEHIRRREATATPKGLSELDEPQSNVPIAITRTKKKGSSGRPYWDYKAILTDPNSIKRFFSNLESLYKKNGWDIDPASFRKEMNKVLRLASRTDSYFTYSSREFRNNVVKTHIERVRVTREHPVIGVLEDSVFAQWEKFDPDIARQMANRHNQMEREAGHLLDPEEIWLTPEQTRGRNLYGTEIKKATTEQSTPSNRINLFDNRKSLKDLPGVTEHPISQADIERNETIKTINRIFEVPEFQVPDRIINKFGTKLDSPDQTDVSDLIVTGESGPNLLEKVDVISEDIGRLLRDGSPGSETRELFERATNTYKSDNWTKALRRLKFDKPTLGKLGLQDEDPIKQMIGLHQYHSQAGNPASRDIYRAVVESTEGEQLWPYYSQVMGLSTADDAGSSVLIDNLEQWTRSLVEAGKRTRKVMEEVPVPFEDVALKLRVAAETLRLTREETQQVREIIRTYGGLASGEKAAYLNMVANDSQYLTIHPAIELGLGIPTKGGIELDNTVLKIYDRKLGETLRPPPPDKPIEIIRENPNLAPTIPEEAPTPAKPDVPQEETIEEMLKSQKPLEGQDLTTAVSQLGEKFGGLG